MKNSLTIKMTMLTLAAFLLTSTLSFAQPGHRGPRPSGPKPSAHKAAPSRAPKAAPPVEHKRVSAPAPVRHDVRPPAPRPQHTPSFSDRRSIDRAIDAGRRAIESRLEAQHRPGGHGPGPGPRIAPPSRPTPGPRIAPPSRPTPGPRIAPPSRPAPSPKVAPRPTPGPGPKVAPPPRPHHPTPGPGPKVVPPPKPHHPTPGPGPKVVPPPKPHHPTPGPGHHPGPGYRPGPDYRPGPGPHRPTHIPSGVRPSWQNRPHDHFDRIYRDMHRTIHGPHVPPPPRAPRPYWDRWGISVALGWTNFAISTGAFTFSWWDSRPYAAPWWNYYYYRRAYPVYYWWERPTWERVRLFYPAYNWVNPYYYDYGVGGNVIVATDGYVYINNQRVATQYEYSQSAAELATYNMPAAETPTNSNLEWLPLGTFALSTSSVDPDKYTKAAIQLAATKDGLISGSFYNRETNQAFPIQGRVDTQTQRVAFYVIGAESTIFETGMYNLTQQDAPVMVHLNGGRQVKNYLLVRLTAPTGSAATTEPVITSPVVTATTATTLPEPDEDDYALPIIDNSGTNAEKALQSILE